MIGDEPLLNTVMLGLLPNDVHFSLKEIKLDVIELHSSPCGCMFEDSTTIYILQRENNK